MPNNLKRRTWIFSYFTTADGATYAYDYNPAHGSNLTFLLLHGYPSSHRDYEHQILSLTAAGYGTLAPDLLGLGRSDMPTELEAYNMKRLAGHITELLDEKNLDTVIGVGHDWGALLLSRLAAYHQDRFQKLAFMSVGHTAPGGFFDLDAGIIQSQADFGYSRLGYWYFFHRHDAASVIEQHLESAWCLWFSNNQTVWREHVGEIGASRAWLNADIITADPPGFDEAFKNDWFTWMRRQGAAQAGLSYYKALMDGLWEEDENALPNEKWTLNVPVLTIGGSDDVISRPDILDASTRPWAMAGYEARLVPGGHWVQHEAPEQVSLYLLEFARE
ncbi:Alpha/Beta hydrolase protein [Stachybotrys elegans]|uniref:Alpha/Beta hydrolase protein n=1 Tax=Stachybotrys elegans TaxID=80388 RepID=A0A8K0SG07_9HYPO|nr:Alpha/Beta hydrolase protein [Stachybotrys elegans]